MHVKSKLNSTFKIRKECLLQRFVLPLFKGDTQKDCCYEAARTRTKKLVKKDLFYVVCNVYCVVVQMMKLKRISKSHKLCSRNPVTAVIYRFSSQIFLSVYHIKGTAFYLAPMADFSSQL